MTQLNNFIAEVKSHGMANASLYQVKMHIPTGIANYDFVKSKATMAMMYCEAASLPGISFGTTSHRRYGETFEVPYEKLYDDVTLSFYIDQNMYVKRLFDEWHALIQDNRSRNFTYPSTYYSNDVTISTISRGGKETYSCTLRDVYPKTVGAVGLSYSDSSVLKLSVTFSYKNYEITQNDRPVGKSKDFYNTPENFTDSAMLNIQNIIPNLLEFLP